MTIIDELRHGASPWKVVPSKECWGELKHRVKRAAEKDWGIVRLHSHGEPHGFPCLVRYRIENWGGGLQLSFDKNHGNSPLPRLKLLEGLI